MIYMWASLCHCHPIVSCFIKIQIGFTFLVPVHPGCPGKGTIKLGACLSPRCHLLPSSSNLFCGQMPFRIQPGDSLTASHPFFIHELLVPRRQPVCELLAKLATPKPFPLWEQHTICTTLLTISLVTRNVSSAIVVADKSSIHPFNCLFSRTTWVSWRQKDKSTLDFKETRGNGVVVASAGPYANHLPLRQTDNHNHASTSSLNFYRPDALCDDQLTVSKHWRQRHCHSSATGIIYTSILLLKPQMSVTQGCWWWAWPAGRGYWETGRWWWLAGDSGRGWSGRGRHAMMSVS